MASVKNVTKNCEGLKYVKSHYITSVRMKVYGFSATVQRERSRGYVARIKELHANTQGRTIDELRSNLKDVAKLMIIDVLEHEKLYSKATVEKARIIVMKALA